MKTNATSPPRDGPDGGVVSVIIPVFNEAARLLKTLQLTARLPGVEEVIVVDGGSTDQTAAIAREQPVVVVRSDKGRAKQMNAGAALATSEILLFLHADTTLPADAMTWVERTLADPNVVAGAFRTWTCADEGQVPFWAPLLHLADVRSRYSRLPYGDQALFVRAPTFKALGGFADIPLMEDLDFSQRLWTQGNVVTVPASVRVSGRRFVARPIAYTLAVNVFPLLFRLGVSPQTLSALYGHVR